MPKYCELIKLTIAAIAVSNMRFILSKIICGFYLGSIKETIIPNIVVIKEELQDVEDTPNPIICKSGILVYWKVEEIRGDWVSLIGTNSYGAIAWTVVGISFDQETALTKARERVIWESFSK